MTSPSISAAACASTASLSAATDGTNVATATLNSYSASGSADYTFGAFPNPDRAVGELVQIRTRDGKPQQKLVALPVKDPFHLPRALIYCVEVLERLMQESPAVKKASTAPWRSSRFAPWTKPMSSFSWWTATMA